MRGGGDSLWQEPAGVVCGLWCARDDGHGGNRRSHDCARRRSDRLRSGSTQSLPAANHLTSAGEPFLDLLLRRGHYCDTPIGALRDEALESLAEARAALDAQAKPFGGWEDAQRQLAALHPTRERYFDRFAEVWTAARAAALAHDLVSWPDAPIRYVPIPEHTRDAAPLLYYLFYRSPAAFDRLPIHDYVVTPPEVSIASDSTITLNHVIHHGGIGHHVQNWHAYRSASRIGQVAAIDAASRIAMFSGGSLAEGWACYVCDLMEEIGFLSPLEQVSQQHTRVRLLARAVVDLSLHSGTMDLRAAETFYREQGLMPAAAAAGEAVKTSMFPGAAVMYWLGTRGIHDLRRSCAAREGAAFSLRRFHDRLLSFGAIPVGLIRAPDDRAGVMRRPIAIAGDPPRSRAPRVRAALRGRRLRTIS